MSSPGSSVSRAQISGEETRAYTLQAIPPQPFGKYTLIGKLGHGGMAEVLLAVAGGKAGFRKLVVLKRLHAQLEIEPGLIDMFLDEARLAAQLDHPNCVQTIEVGAVRGADGHEQHFLAMEYLDGQGLDRLLRASAASGILLPVPMAVRIVADALEGLGYAHELQGFDGTPLGVVHRDVSPQNIFVTYNGIVKLLDFGIAKAESNVVETRTGVVKGKYAYIAPEQALGQPVDQRADIWSMGVVLWECLTSRRLFKSVNELATLQETLRGEIRVPSAFNPAVDRELDAIVMHALQREVGERFQTASGLKDALESWLEDHGGAQSRKQISAMMKERFDEVHRVHKEKLAACLAAVEVGPSGIQKLVDGGGGSDAGTSGQFSNMTPSSARLIAGAPSVTPTPMPGAPPVVVPPPAAVPSDREEKRRALAWQLIAIAAIALVAVLIAIAVPRYEQEGPAATAPVAVVPTAVPPVAPDPVPVPAPVPVPDPIVAPEIAPDPIAPDPIDPTLAADPTVTPEVEADDPGPRRTGRRGGTRTTPGETTAPPPEPPPPAPAEDGFGYLSLATSPWTTVTLDGRTLGDTPLVRERLPAGRHTLRLTNADLGISEIYEVEIRAGETTTRRLGLR